jgi:hypothetical protein
MCVAQAIYTITTHSFFTSNIRPTGSTSNFDACLKPSNFLGLPIAALRRSASSWSACRGIYDGRPITTVFWCLPRRPGFLQIVALFLRPHLWHILSRLSMRSSTLYTQWRLHFQHLQMPRFMNQADISWTIITPHNSKWRSLLLRPPHYSRGYRVRSLNNH